MTGLCNYRSGVIWRDRTLLPGRLLRLPALRHEITSAHSTLLLNTEGRRRSNKPPTHTHFVGRYQASERARECEGVEVKLHACVRGSNVFESNQMPPSLVPSIHHALLYTTIMGEILPDCPSRSLSPSFYLSVWPASWLQKPIHWHN